MDSGDWWYQLAGPKCLRIWTKPGLNWYSEETAYSILVGTTPDRSKLPRKDGPSHQQDEHDQDANTQRYQETPLVPLDPQPRLAS
jgi:hypothetical protein